MTAPLLTPRQEGRARVVATQIGEAFRAERLRHGDRLKDIGEYIGTRSEGNVSLFERGRTPNLMLGTALRYLAIYGLTLAVVRISDVRNRS